MVQSRQVISLVLSAALLVGAAFLTAYATDDGNAYGVKVTSLDTGGAMAQAARAAPVTLAGIDVYGLAADGRDVAAPAALQGVIGDITFRRSPVDGPDVVLLLGGKPVPIPVGAHVTIEQVTGALELIDGTPLPTLALDGAAKRVVVTPAEGTPIPIPNPPFDEGIPVVALALDGVLVEAPVDLVGVFEEVAIMPANHDSLDAIWDLVPGGGFQGGIDSRENGLGLDPRSVDVPPVIRIVNAYVRLWVTMQDGVMVIEVEGLAEILLFPGQPTGDPRIDDRFVPVFQSESLVLDLKGRHREVLGTANAHPNADFTWDPPQPRLGDTIQLIDRSDGGDAWDRPASYDWVFCDNTSTDVQSPVYTHTIGGPCPVTLTVTDQLGATDSITKTITFGGEPPELAITVQPDPSTILRPTYFNATATDPDGTAVTVTWTFHEGTVLTGMNVAFQYGDKGVFPVDVRAVDEDGDTTTTTVQVTVADVRPIADFVFSPDAPLSRSPVTFTDTSHDPDATPGTEPGIVSRTWSAPGQSVRTGASISYSFARPGTYPVTLTVEDEAGQTATITKQVPIANRPPLLNASADRSLANANEPVTFTATYWDPDGPSASRATPPTPIRWEDNGVQFHAGSNPTRSFQVGGFHEIRAIATDADGATVVDYANVTVNRAPIIDFEAIPGTELDTGEELILRDLSTDPDGGGPLTREWRWSDGPVSTDQEHRRTFTTSGVRVVTLTVTDPHGASLSLPIEITVHNRLPSVAITSGPGLPTENEVVTYGATANDPDGTITLVRWFVDGTQAGTGLSLQRAFTGGNHTLEVRATDDQGAVATATQQIRVNFKPRIVAGASPNPVFAGQPVTFTASVVDPDGETTTPVDWRFGDGDYGAGAPVQHTYMTAGTYRVFANSSDPNGALGSTSFTLTVNPPPFSVSIDVTPDTTLPATGESLTFTATPPVGHNVVKTKWTFGLTAAIEVNGASTPYTFTRSGVHLVSVEATSHTGATFVKTRIMRVVSGTPLDMTVELLLPDQQLLNVTYPDVGYTVRVSGQSGDVATSFGATPTVQRLGLGRIGFQIPANTWAVGDEVLLRVHFGSEIRTAGIRLEHGISLYQRGLSAVPTRVYDVTLIAPSAADPGTTRDGVPVYNDLFENVEVSYRVEWFERTVARDQVVPVSVEWGTPRASSPPLLQRRFVELEHVFTLRSDEVDGLGRFDVPMPLWPKIIPDEIDPSEGTAPGGGDPIPILAGNELARTLAAEGLVYLPGRFTVVVGPTMGSGSVGGSAAFFVDLGGVVTGAGLY